MKHSVDRVETGVGGIRISALLVVVGAVGGIILAFAYPVIAWPFFGACVGLGIVAFLFTILIA